MLFDGVAADHEDAVRFFHLWNAIGHRSTAKGTDQAGYRRGVAEASAMVHVVGANNSPSKLHEEKVLLIGAFSRGENADRIGTGILSRSAQTVANDF